MTTRRRKTDEGDEWSITLSKKNAALIVFGVVFFASGNPVLQKAGNHLLGITSPVTNIEEIKTVTNENTKQIAAVVQTANRTEQKVNELIVEMERLKMEAAKLALKSN